MKIGVLVFISSMAFGIVIAAVYGYTTHDNVGVIMLGGMALALTIVAGYIIVAEREANLAGDHEDMAPSDIVGEELGVFTLESYWPILAAVGTATLFLGLVFLPGIAVAMVIAGGALVAWTVRFLVREST